jgi:hypothetical protein
MTANPVALAKPRCFDREFTACNLILGDSLQVMASLAQREDLAGKVQMIYVDPPYQARGVAGRRRLDPSRATRSLAWIDSRTRTAFGLGKISFVSKLINETLG